MLDGVLWVAGQKARGQGAAKATKDNKHIGLSTNLILLELLDHVI